MADVDLFSAWSNKLSVWDTELVLGVMDGNVLVFCDLVFRRFSSPKAQYFSVTDMHHLFRMIIVVFKFVRLESQVQYTVGQSTAEGGLHM